MAQDWVVEVRGETTPVVVYSGGMRVLEGDLSAEYGAVLEVLRTPGVDSYRHRLKGRELKPLKLLLNEDVVKTRDIYLSETLYQNAEGELCTLTVSILDVKVRWKRVMVERAQTVGRDGPLVGFSAKPSSRHTLWSEWTFMRQAEGEILS